MKDIENCIFSILFLLLALYISNQKYGADLDQILKGLLTEEEFPLKSEQNRVAIGFGSCLDVYVDGVELLKELGIAPPEKTLHNSIICSEQDLAETFAFFFQQGSAAE